MELARIVAMSMILIWHFVLLGLQGEDRFLAKDSFGELQVDQYVQIAVSIICICGVNLFVLISGYYRIKLRWKSLLNYYCLCLFYNLLIVGVSSVYETVGLHSVLSCFLISRTNNWFFKAYFILMLVSPVLNAALDAFSLRQLRMIALIILMLTCLTGWMLRNGNEDGYNCMQLMAMYLFGGYLSKETCFDRIDAKLAICCFGIICLLSYLIAMIVYYLMGKEITTLLHYNYFLIVIESICLFLFFLKLSVKSRIVNKIASTVVGCMFVQEAIGRPLYSFIHSYFMRDGFTAELFLYLALIFIAIFILAFVLETVRKALFRGIVDIGSEKLESIVSLHF